MTKEQEVFRAIHNVAQKRYFRGGKDPFIAIKYLEYMRKVWMKNSRFVSKID